MGILDNINLDDPKQAGLLNLAFGLLSQGGPSTTPVSLGQAFSRAGQQGMGAYQQARQQQAQQAQLAQQQKLTDLKIQEGTMSLQRLQSDLARSKQIQDAYKAYSAPSSNTSEGQASTVDASPMMSSMPAAKTTAGGAQSAGSDNYQRHLTFAQFLQDRGLAEEAQKYYDLAEKFKPKFATEFRQAVGPDGKLRNYQVADDGTIREAGLGVKPDMTEIDQGGYRAFVDKNAVTPNQKFAKTYSPGDMVQMRGQNMTDARGRELNAITREGQQTQIIDDPVRGPILVNKGTGLARPAVGLDGQPVTPSAMVKRTQAAQNLMPILEEADKLIDKSTGSYVGAGLDILGRTVGTALPGDRASSRLKVLEGNLMLNQPRMEGPQSDRDVQIYRQMAGQIGDPMVPNKIKKDALQTIRDLNSKYAEKPSGGQPSKTVDFGSLR